MTTKFNGPASGIRLTLRRAPLFLRLVLDAAGKWDALDQPDDEPGPSEEIHAYRKVSDDGGGFMDYTDRATGRRKGFAFQSATYAFVDPQPDDATLRDTEKWRAWCLAQVAPKPEGQQP